MAVRTVNDRQTQINFKAIRRLLFIGLCIVIAACSRSGSGIDLRQKARVDGMNKEAFLNRYDAPDVTIGLSQSALRFIADTLPAYHDGRLRAWNNLAKAYYIVSMPDSSAVYADSVLNYGVGCKNRDIERLIAKLTHARVRQRNCDIAGSYKMLYEVAQSDIAKGVGEGFLYDYARSEYYVTLLSLNYHYRKGMQRDVQSLLDEAEAVAPGLKCDYAQDMVTNFALAYGHVALCTQKERQAENLRKALGYIMANLELLSDSSRFSLLHFANTVQLTAAIAANRTIAAETWRSCSAEIDTVCAELRRQGLAIESDSTLALTLYIESSYMFEDYGDPYHTLGAMVATGDLCLQNGDTAAARTWLIEALARLSESGITAPKYESLLYGNLLASGTASSAEEASRWAARYIELHDFIKQNEERDFILQTELSNARHTIADYRALVAVIAVLALMLVALAVMLAIRTRVLRREKQRLQQMRRKDVERIANVETCLSVMRHDINPFVSYLQNKKLPQELRDEVLAQLIRTFENIKNWTNLSIPSGLAFNAAECDANEIIAEAVAMSPKPNGEVAIVTPQHPNNQATGQSINIYGDRLLLIIMLRNLIANALQHTERGSVAISAGLWTEDARFAEFTVNDTGCGMTAEQIENLFRADRKPEQGSQHSGFGLILCRYIVKKHDDNTLRGCRIWAESTAAPAAGHGTRIHVLVQQAAAKESTD